MPEEHAEAFKDIPEFCEVLIFSTKKNSKLEPLRTVHLFAGLGKKRITSLQLSFVLYIQEIFHHYDVAVILSKK